MAKTEEQEDNPTAWVCMTSVHNPLTTASHSWAQSQGTGKRVLSMEIEGVNSLEQPAISVQSLSRVQLFAAPWIAAHEASLSITNSRNLLKLVSITSVMPSNHLILCRSLLLLPSIFPIIRVFSNESTLLIRWPKYWSFSYSISPSNEYSGLISFRMDWLDLLGVQGTLKSLLQHHSSKASILPSPPLTTSHLIYCLVFMNMVLPRHLPKNSLGTPNWSILTTFPQTLRVQTLSSQATFCFIQGNLS